MALGETVLRVESASRSFGGVYALKDVTLTVKQGETRGIIGPNGAGKSTLFNLVAGNLRPDKGVIEYKGQPLNHLSADHRARLGISLVHQNGGVFGRLSVLENAMMGWQSRRTYGFWRAAFGGKKKRLTERAARAEAMQALDQVGLARLADASASVLTFGQQRAVQIARAICAKPSLLLLDEPAAGLREAERAALVDLLREMQRGGHTMMLVEHDVNFVRSLSSEIAVLVLGQKIADGPAEEVFANQAVIDSYLGVEVNRA